MAYLLPKRIFPTFNKFLKTTDHERQISLPTHYFIDIDVL